MGEIEIKREIGAEGRREKGDITIHNYYGNKIDNHVNVLRPVDTIFCFPMTQAHAQRVFRNY